MKLIFDQIERAIIIDFYKNSKLKSRVWSYFHKSYLVIRYETLKASQKKKPRDKYEIKFFPLSAKFYPTVNGYYFNKSYHTGIIKLIPSIEYAESCSTETGARDLIALYKEQHLLVNVVTINVNNLK